MPPNPLTRASPKAEQSSPRREQLPQAERESVFPRPLEMRNQGKKAMEYRMMTSKAYLHVNSPQLWRDHRIMKEEKLLFPHR